MSERMPTKENRADLASDIDIGKHKEPSSLYQQVMEDPEARRAYFEMMRMSGELSGAPDDENLIAVRKKLEEAMIPYFYIANRRRPRPIFVIENRISVGREEIEAQIASLSED